MACPSRPALALALALSLLDESAHATPPDDSQKDSGVQVRVKFSSDLRKTPLDGRLLVMFSTDSKDEPRFQISDGTKTQQIFGIDVNDLRPDQEAVVDSSVAGYPLESLHHVRPGHYRVQAIDSPL